MKSPKPTHILTERLCLDAIEPRDARVMLALFASEAVGATYMLPTFTAEDERVCLFERFCHLSQQSDRFVYAIRHGEELIGWINDVDTTEDTIELGLVIHPDAQGRGYATEVLTAAIRTLHTMGYACVRTGAFEENGASLRVMEKCGMTRRNAHETVEYRGNIHTCIMFEAQAAPVPLQEGEAV